jgi:uncharacterized protein DUF4919
MRDAFIQLIEAPTQENYLRIREMVLAHESYQPYSEDLSDIGDLVEKGEFQKAQDELAAAMPNLLLSPRAHIFLSIIAREAGSEDAAKMEGHVACACAEGIMATGDGSEEMPYVVVRTSDEYDLIEYLDAEMTGQRLTHKDDQHFDVLTTKDGRELWFDITVPYAKMGDEEAGG